MEMKELFSKPIQKLLDEKGFNELTEPQKKAIPLIFEGKNVLIVAPTGTGKTEAAFLPILDMMLREERKTGIKVLYITPLRALNRDLMERLQWWCSKLDFKISVRHGDTDVRERGRQATSPPDILITTPETLQAILTGKVLRKHLSKLKWIIVDEVHELTDDKRGSQLSIALERLRKILEKEPQIIGLSATIGSPEVVAKFLVGSERNCEIVKVSAQRNMKLSVEMPEVREDDIYLSEKLATFPEVAARIRRIKELIDENRSTLVFTNTRSEAEVLASRFRVWDMNIPISIHHGSLSKTSRIETEGGLKKGELKGVVCTSSLELGIDIGTIDLVIQYNSPRQVTRLVQRIGRAGHWIGGVAKGVIIAMDSDDVLESIVIARRALKEELEDVKIIEKPLDVLTHQIAGLIIEYKRMKLDEILELVRKAYPFRNLTKEELISVLEYMSNRRPRLALYIPEEDIVIKARPYNVVFKYYFENLSMIPEEKHYLVVDEEKDEAIGMLDEAFVAEYGEPGVKFIVRGSPWRILHIYNDIVYVKAENDPVGAIPDWIGDEIPVLFEVAQEVGKIRDFVYRKLKEGMEFDNIINELCKIYPVSKDLLKRALSEVKEQFENNMEVPTHKVITIEEWEDYIIINCTFGLMINKALARILGYLITEYTGSGVGVSQDPYRIFFKTSIDAKTLLKIINDINTEEIEKIVEKAIERSGLFKRRLLHVAKRFGVISKGADLSDIGMNQLMESLKGSIIWKETLKEISYKDLDVEGLKYVIERMKKGDYEIKIIEGLSPISRVGVRKLSWKSDIIPADRLRRILIESGKARILNEARIALCTECFRYMEIVKIKNILDKLICPNCKSKKIALLDGDPNEINQMMIEITEKGRVSEKFKKIYRDAIEIGELIEKYGLPAILAITAKNLPWPSIIKISSSNIKNLDSLIDMILREEKESLKMRFKFK
jgi:ATP-dependent Lhr-like helicase